MSTKQRVRVRRPPRYERNAVHAWNKALQKAARIERKQLAAGPPAVVLGPEKFSTTASGRAYRCHMSENPARQGPAPEEPEQDSKTPAEPLSTQLDPDFVPDPDSSTPEEKTVREKPEETGS